MDSEEEIDISQMTWEEKETVLQHLLLNLDVSRRQAQNRPPDVKIKDRKISQVMNMETGYIKHRSLHAITSYFKKLFEIYPL